MIRHSFNENSQVLEVVNEGEVTREDIIDFYKSISENDKLPRKLKAITDSRNATYNFDLETLMIYKDCLRKTLAKYDYIQAAFIHSKPRETAYSLMIELNNNFENYSHRIFISEKIAIEWLEN